MTAGAWTASPAIEPLTGLLTGTFGALVVETLRESSAMELTSVVSVLERGREPKTLRASAGVAGSVSLHDHEVTAGVALTRSALLFLLNARDGESGVVRHFGSHVDVACC